MAQNSFTSKQNASKRQSLDVSSVNTKSVTSKQNNLTASQVSLLKLNMASSKTKHQKLLRQEVRDGVKQKIVSSSRPFGGNL